MVPNFFKINWKENINHLDGENVSVIQTKSVLIDDTYRLQLLLCIYVYDQHSFKSKECLDERSKKDR